MRIGEPLHVIKEDKISYVRSIWWDAPESMIQELGEE
jgi:hypothetical protein